MKKKEFTEAKSKNVAQLKKMVAELRTEMAHLKVDQTLGKLKNPRQMTTKRKSIAQALTLIKQKAFEESKSNKKEA